MKNAGVLPLFVSASALILTACASQAPLPQTAAVPGARTAAPAVTVMGSRYGGTRRVVKDGVDYFCERPTPTGSHFIALREQCFTGAQLRALREHDQDFVRRQQALALQTNTTSVVRTPISP